MWKKVRRPQEEKSRYIKRLKKCWIYKENQDMKKLVSTDFSVENWLILGEKWSMMIATADKYGCRTLPMRNWHIHHMYSSYTPSPDFQSDITYEELTHLVTWDRCNNHLCRTLPMRNWHDTFNLERYIYSWSFCRTLPMRNWHIGCNFTLFLFKISKPVGHYLWGIDTFC